jgi:hypothetical protein
MSWHVRLVPLTDVAAPHFVPGYRQGDDLY